EPAEDALARAVAELTGEIQQVPSAVSAIKVQGKRSYARVRAGEEVDLPARPVTVAEFSVLSSHPEVVNDLPVLDLQVRTQVSSGTYIRALARDLGRALGVGGHLTRLRRTRVGDFTIQQASELPDFTSTPTLMPMRDVAARIFPGCALTSAQAAAVRSGQQISGVDLPDMEPNQPVAGYDPAGELVALLTELPDSDRLRPVLVIPTD
ncbi:MAG: tRNA pseudouridine(55) synthase TruB, partial [Angustibacter sp.]